MLKRTDGLGCQTDLLVQFRQGDANRVTHGVEINYLLEHRNGAGIVPLTPMQRGDLCIVGNRLFHLAPATVGITDLEQQLRILGIGGKQFPIFLEGFRSRAFLHVLACSVEDFSFIDGHQEGPRGTTWGARGAQAFAPNNSED